MPFGDPFRNGRTWLISFVSRVFLYCALEAESSIESFRPQDRIALS